MPEKSAGIKIDTSYIRLHRVRRQNGCEPKQKFFSFFLFFFLICVLFLFYSIDEYYLPFCDYFLIYLKTFIFVTSLKRY